LTDTVADRTAWSDGRRRVWSVTASGRHAGRNRHDKFTLNAGWLVLHRQKFITQGRSHLGQSRIVMVVSLARPV
jgi:hypothetical protein